MAKKQETEPSAFIPAFNNTQAERMVIGAILSNPGKTWHIVRQLNASDEWFTDRICLAVFNAIQALVSAGSPVDLVLVGEEIRKNKTTNSQALSQEFMLQAESWISMSGNGKNIEKHLQILEDKWKRRDAAFYLQDGIEQLQSDSSTDFIIGSVKHSLTKLYLQTSKPEESMATVMQTLQDSFVIAKECKGTGVPVPWSNLQRLISGLPKGKVTIIAARPKQGKSTVANNIAEYLCWNQKLPVGIWSMEMTRGEWIANMIGSHYGLDISMFQAGLYAPEDMKTFEEACKEVETLPIYIHDRPQTIHTLCASIREEVMEKNLQFVVIDYLQLIRGDGTSKNTNRQQEVASWSNEICNLAKECSSTAFMVVSQLSRAGVSEGLKRPELHHLRDTGSLEQDAYMVLFVYQDPNAGDTPLPDNAPTILEVAARRGGRTGVVSLVFQKSKQRLVV